MKYTFHSLTLTALCSLAIPASTQGMHSASSFGNLVDTLTAHKGAAITVAAVAGLSSYVYYKITNYRKSLHWDWSKIDTDTASFPKNFTWGTATSAHQVEANCNNNQWAHFARNGLKLQTGDLQEKEKAVNPAGNACEFDTRYESDADLMRDMGANSHRFSVEWSKVMPKEGVIEQAELERYATMCAAFQARGIRPAITLYHYTEPLWFYEKGGFEKEENIQHFVKFCRITAEKLQKYNPLWFTFNAAEGHATQGWLKGMKPPAKINEFKLTAQVLFNLLQAHVLAYLAIHEVDKNAQVGILKNIMQLDPARLWHPVDHISCIFGSNLVDKSLFDFFKTGNFNVWVPTKVSFKAESKELKELIKKGNHALDFVGLNYYCHNYMRGTKTEAETNETLEPRTNNPRYPIYGEGLYRAVKEVAEKMAKPCGNLPIYVTENGVAANNDEDGNKIRDLHNRRYMYALSKAIKDGYDVRGYFHWSFMDNYEWGSYGKNYGMVEVQRDNNLTRVLKPGAQFLVNLMKKTKTNNLK